MGKSIKPSPGRGKGTPNRVTLELKDMIMTALSNSHPDGGVGYLKQLAIDEPASFTKLLSALIPRNINATVAIGLHDVLQKAEERLITMRPKTDVDVDGKSTLVH